MRRRRRWRSEDEYDRRKNEGLNPIRPQCWCTEESSDDCPQHNPLYYDQKRARRKEADDEGSD